MSIISYIKKEIQAFFLKRVKASHDHMMAIEDLNQANSLALFFCIQTKKELDEIRDLSKKAMHDYRKLRIFVFTNSRDSLDVITNKSIFFFNLDDFTIMGKMKERLAESIEKDTYDLLISFENQEHPICRKMISELRAGFKIGTDIPAMADLYQLILACNEDEFDFTKYYEQVRHYISVLNIKAKA